MRRKDGCTLDTENEKQRVTQCLIAAVKRRASQVCLTLPLIRDVDSTCIHTRNNVRFMFMGVGLEIGYHCE